MTATILLIIGVMVGVFIGVQLLWVLCNGRRVPLPMICREPQFIGSGPTLRYVVLGDSTTLARGGDYSQGYAVATASYLGMRHHVVWCNFGQSSANAATVMAEQLPLALNFSPDVALVAVGANDVFRFTPARRFGKQLNRILQQLRASNRHMNIIVTGAPAMGAVPRLPPFLRYVMKWRTEQFNRIAKQLAQRYEAVFAPIAEQTEDLYLAHPELFASDKFHPTTDGYQPWIPILQRALDEGRVTT